MNRLVSVQIAVIIRCVSVYADNMYFGSRRAGMENQFAAVIGKPLIRGYAHFYRAGTSQFVRAVQIDNVVFQFHGGKLC